MKILLIRAPSNFEAYEPPLGILYLAAFLRSHALSNVSVVDCDLNKETYETLKKHSKN